MQEVRKFLSKMTLSQRFMLASLIILFAGMLGIGAWVGRQIATGVIHRTGATTALYVDSFVTPYLQDLSQSGELSSSSEEKLSKLLQDTPMGQTIVAFKLWDTRGKVLYSTDQSAVGKTFPMHASMLRARLGEVVTTKSTLDDEENALLGVEFDNLLETYSPVWLSGTDQVIAVAEFYQLTDDLDREIRMLQRRSWVVVGFAILLVYLLLAGFVNRTSDTISRQQVDLEKTVDQLTDLLQQNRELHRRVRRAAASIALLNEGYLRRIGSEIHDGPTQDLGLSLLKLDTLVEMIEDQNQEPETHGLVMLAHEIGASLRSAMEEMRGIATGLSLPQLGELSLDEAILRVIRSHERRTGTKVSLITDALPEDVALPLKVNVYRLIQEGLNNAYRHAEGLGQEVQIRMSGDYLIVEILDRGPGFDPDQVAGWAGHLGINGMRERVESMGGSFMIESKIQEGTRILASLPTQIEEEIL